MTRGNGKVRPAVSSEVAPLPPGSYEGVLFNDAPQMISREQALERFFTPRDGYEHLEPTLEELFLSPDGTFALLNPRTAFVAPQIRELYDSARIERMGVSIRDTEDGQLQNAGVSFIDRKHIKQYLSDMNDYFGTSIRLKDLTFHEAFDCYVITAYGHNRQLAIASANLATNGHPDVGLRFFVKAFHNPEFWRILGNQATENTGEAPPTWVRARQIVMYLEFRNRGGVEVKDEDVGRLFNVDKDQIWRAKRYDALPQPIKELVMAGKLPYSGSFELDMLRNVYDDEYIIDLAYKLAERKAMRPQIMEAIRQRLAASVLTPEIKQIIENGMLTLPQAQELVKLKTVMDDNGLNEFTRWICIARPDIDEIRAKVRDTVKSALDGNRNLFGEDGNLSGNHSAIENLRKELGLSDLRAGIQGTVSDITRGLSGIRELISAGLIGGLIEQKPFAGTTREYFTELVDSLVKVLNDRGKNGEYGAEIARLEAILGIETEDEVSRMVDAALTEIEALLKLEASETEMSQDERRARLGRNIAEIISAPTPVQDGLF